MNADSDLKDTARWWDRGDWAALAILGGVVTLTCVIMIRYKPQTGVWEDDGVYLATAKSLAEGSGYRRPDLPGAPYQTKYPPLYPIALSAIWRMSSCFPDNVGWVRLLNSICGFGAGFLAYWVARHAWRVPVWLAIVATTAALAAPYWVEMTQYAMSEHLYGLLSMASLACLFSKADDKNDRRFRSGFALLSGALSAGALLCRSIGIMVAPAVVAAWLLRRKWREAVLASLLPAAAWAGWWTWRSHAAAANAEIPQCASLTYDLDYSAWIPKDAATTARVAWLNTATLGLSLLESTVLPPHELLERAARCNVSLGDWPFALFAVIGMTAIMLLMVCGLVASARRGNWAVHLYLALYGATMLAWPYRLDRFTVPLLPLLNTLMLFGLWNVARLVWRGLSAVLWTTTEETSDTAPSVALEPLGHAPRSVSSAHDFVDRLLKVGGLVLTVHFLLFDHRAAVSPKEVIALARRDAAMTIIRERTEPTAVIAGVRRAYVFLATGRKIIPVLPFDDPVELNYPPDRSFLSAGRQATPGHERAMEANIDTRAGAYFRKTGVGYVFLEDDGSVLARVLSRFFARNSDRFTVVGDAGPFRLWQFR